MNRAFAALLSLALTLGGCARDDTVYPSLAPRPVERLGFEEPEAPPPAPVAADPELDLEIAAVAARLVKAARDFSRAAVQAQTVARSARGASAGSEAWITAQTALAELDGLRAETSEVATDIDQLAIARAATLAPDYPALETAREQARDELERQEAIIARIGAELAPA